MFGAVTRPLSKFAKVPVADMNAYNAGVIQQLKV